MTADPLYPHRPDMITLRVSRRDTIAWANKQAG